MKRETSDGSALSDPAAVQARQIEKDAFQEGWRASASTIPAVLAWGIVSGMAMVKSGMTIWQSLGMTLLVYAGSAQFAILPLLVAHTPLIVIFLTAMIVNLRFVIFSAAVAPHFAHLPWYRRVWYGYFNGDISMGFFPQRFPAHTIPYPAGKVGFFSAICYPGWFAWQIGAVVGILLASQIPESWNIGFAGTLALIAIMIPMTINLAALAGVIVAGTVAVAAYSLPYRLGLLLAVVIGMVAAMIADKFLDKEKA